MKELSNSEPIVGLYPTNFKSKIKLQILFGARWLRVFDAWIKRSHQRRELASLDDRQLKDVGITRYEASRESTKPFWR